MESGFEEFVTHSEGFGDCILFSLLDRNYLLSCGSDGDIRILDLSGEKEPNDLYIGPSPIYQLAFVRGKEPGISFACDDNALYWIDLNPVDFSKHKKRILTRFGSSVYAVASDTSGQWLAAGAADFLIKLIPTDSITSNSPQCHSLDSHSAPVLSLSFSSDGRTLCSSSCDGQLMTWCTSTQTRKNKLSILSRPVSDLPISPSRLIVAISPMFSPIGGEVSLIATPHVSSDKEDHSISIISSQDHQIIARLTSDTSVLTKTESRSSGMFHCCCWAPDGHHFGAGTVQGHILIWSCLVTGPLHASFQLVRLLRHTLRGEIVSICWGPAHTLAALSKSGYLILHESLQLDAGGGTNIPPADSEDNSLLDGIAAADLFDSQDSPLISEPTTNPIKPQAMELDGSSRDGKLDLSNSPPEKNYPAVSFRNAAKKRKFIPEIEEVELMDSVYSHSGQSAPPDPGLGRQESFQPSSWPLVSEARDWEHVCLCYNLVGVVISHRTSGTSDTENENQHLNYLIEVEFHDRGVHYPLQLIDPHSFCFGVLTEELLVLGGSGKKSVVPPSGDKIRTVIQVHRFNTWDGSKEWTATLPEGELAVSVSAGKGWVVCVADSCILRLFGSEGTQFDLLRLPGPPLASAGREGRLIVGFHQNSALSDSQCLNYYLLSVSHMRSLSILSEGGLPLSPLSELRWLGLTVSNLPATLDSVGHLQVGRLSARGVLWVPMLDFGKELRKKKYASSLVILGITPSLSFLAEEGESSNSIEEIRYILPTHGSQFPILYPRPSVQCQSYSPPFCPTSSEKCTLERDYFLASYSHGHAARQTQEGLMRIFALAARSGYFQRSVEVGMMLTPHYQQLAITYSAQLQLPALCQRMGSVLNTEQETVIKSRSNAPPSSSEPNTDCIIQTIEENNDDYNSSLPEEEIDHLLSGTKPSTSREAAMNIFSTGRTNPFKQKQTATASASRASSIDKNFIKSVIQKSMGGKHAPTPENAGQQSDTTTITSRQSKLTVRSQALIKSNVAMESDEMSAPQKQTQPGSAEKKSVGFKQWLEQTLPLLEADNPELKKSELIKLATKRWREERKD